ncbi:MAG: right-handed parallel beta-helix repeat-containing protein, partial [Phycisphaerales bacterium]
DGNHTGSVVTSPPGATQTTRVDGFTITNGSAGYGGGLYLYSSSPTIVNNRVTGNNAASGGGLYLEDSVSTIANNTIAGNSADDYGGGLALWYSSPTIANNTITANSAGYYGGGLFLSGTSSPIIANTIVAFNSSYGIVRDTGTPTLRHNCVYGNAEYDYYGLTDPTGTHGNISADPRLADPAYGNVHIQPDSPCVDAGSNADTSGDLDIDGEPRIQGGTVDIGADESDGTVWPAGPYVLVRVSPTGNDANDGSSWALAKRTVQAGIDAASTLGGEVWVQAGTYEECITLHPYAYVFGGFAGHETARLERDWGVHVTILDGRWQDSVVTARATGYGILGAIDGFTITNGSASRGGGMYLLWSSATIANSIIIDNIATGGGGLYL